MPDPLENEMQISIEYAAANSIDWKIWGWDVESMAIILKIY